MNRHTENSSLPYINKDAQKILRDYSWPGNVRELENVLQRAIVLCEKNIIEEDFDVMFLPELWNQEFYNIFNIKVDSDQNGCLQDIHWFGGDFGYFPTYSIGAFIAAQIFDCIKKQNPKLEIDLKNGNFLPIINWLKKNIHSHGNYYKIDELLLNVTGEKLNLKYFEKHITDRYLKEKK